MVKYFIQSFCKMWKLLPKENSNIPSNQNWILWNFLIEFDNKLWHIYLPGPRSSDDKSQWRLKIKMKRENDHLSKVGIFTTGKHGSCSLPRNTGQIISMKKEVTRGCFRLLKIEKKNCQNKANEYFPRRDTEVFSLQREVLSASQTKKKNVLLLK